MKLESGGDEGPNLLIPGPGSENPVGPTPRKRKRKTNPKKGMAETKRQTRMEVLLKTILRRWRQVEKTKLTTEEMNRLI